MKYKSWLSYLLATALSAIVLSAANLSVAVVSKQSSPHLLGTSMTITATVVGDPDPTPDYVYSFSVAPPGGPAQVRQGFARSSSFIWTPNAFEGTFTISATVKNLHAGTSGTSTFQSTVVSRLVQGLAAVNQTNHPLVAFFSGPSCVVPNRMRVRFTPLSTPPGGIQTSMTTNAIPCRYDATSSTPNATSMNFYVAGLYPVTAYNMHWEVLNPGGTMIRQGTDLRFRTGSVPTELDIPTFTKTGQATGNEQIVVHASLRDLSVGTDTSGNVLWYSTNVDPVSMELGGNYLGPVFSTTDPYEAGIREVDLAGNTVIGTTQGAINEQLQAMGKRKVRAFHHDLRRIYTGTGAPPDGYIVALVGTERVSTSAQGGTPENPVLILGDGIIVLDQNLQVVWTWDAFDFLDMSVPAIFDNKCSNPGGRGCVGFNPAFTVGNDWLHVNSVKYHAYDGNIIFSARHQDSVIKVNFANGQGDGHVIWKLGNGPIRGVGGTPFPTFRVFTNNTKGTHDLAYPWFSHQHDAEIQFGGAVIGGARILTLYDNGNTRLDRFNPNAHSRCQLWAINEDTLVANLNRNADLGVYASSVGSAQMLSNNHTSCDSGNTSGLPDDAYTTESDVSTDVVYTLSSPINNYRAFRMVNMYTPPNP